MKQQTKIEMCKQVNLVKLEEKRAEVAEKQVALEERRFALAEKQAILNERQAELENKRIENKLQVLNCLKDMKLNLGTDGGRHTLRKFLREPQMERAVPSPEPIYETIETTDSDEYVLYNV